MKEVAAKIYGGLAELKNKFYDSGFLDQIKVSSPVLSVGNLTMGGTGKTPVVDLLLTHFESKGLRCCLISRNYKAQVSDFAQIDLRRVQGAEWYGDEPWLLAGKHPQASVFVGPSKSQSLLKASRKGPFDVFVVDDGFQHRAFYRNLDIVLIDATENWIHYQPLPQGRAREIFSNLGRAQVVVLTKTEQASPEQLELMRAKIAAVFRGPVVECESRMSPSTDNIKGKKIFAFSGLAKPTGFEEFLRPLASELKTLRFADHHRYTEADIVSILQMADGFDHIVTTEKDLVKLQGTALGVRCDTVKVHFEITKGEPEFYALVDSVLR